MKVGILGGGQLAQMLAIAGIPLGIKFHFYFPNKENCLNQLGQIHSGEYNDFEALKKFSDQVDVITYENENIPVATLNFLSESNKIYPDKNALKVASDRLFEKNTFCKLKIPTNRYIEVNTIEELSAAGQILGYPFMLKKRTLGYDGKGQVKINLPADLSKISNDQCINLIAEEFVPFDRELSIIAARNNRSEIVFYDICENVHRDGILFKTINRASDLMFELAKNYLEKLLIELDYVGILTIEFFQIGNKLIANEIAPRVHNSGHWTRDACITSQFENHLRSILNLSLGDTTSISQACMYNILNKMPDKNTLLNFNGLGLYHYQKTPRKGRKLGHVTLLNHDINNDMIDLEKILMNC